MVRQPAVAGKFYPRSPDTLRQTVERYLTEAPPPPQQGALRALIAPHAGYPYSGPIAGSAFASLAAAQEGQPVRRIVLIGPAHFVPVSALAASSASAFATPLGDVAVDSTAPELAHVRPHDAAHRPEHALEVELPFLQTVLDDFQIVPLLVGQAAPDSVADTLQTLWDEETVLVVSSDLSHHHDYQTATRLDAETARRIEALQLLDEDAACGRAAINGLLRLAQQNGWRAHTVDLRNSGDTAGPRDRVVGYGAFVFTENGSS